MTAVAGLLAAAACAPLGLFEPSGTGGIAGRIDERTGVFAGVRIGASTAAMHVRFGPRAPATHREPIIPANSVIDDFRGPTLLHLGTRWYRYDGVVVFTDRGRVTGFSITSRGSATRAAVAIGDPIRRVAEAYPRLECGVANEHTEYASYPACAGRIGRVYVWFGGDPVSTITMGNRPLLGL